MIVSLLRLDLSYADGTVLNTASSGAVPTLDELRLVIEDGGNIAALGASRVNISYLSGIPADDVVRICVAICDCVDWSGSWRAPDDAPAPARMLFEMAAADGAARAAGVGLSVWLGGGIAARIPTNQTLFRCDDATLIRRAKAYMARGFRDLKLRVGFGPFADDLRRLALLRESLGSEVRLSVDANGAWTAAEALTNLAQLAAIGLAYVEQPIAAGNWNAIAQVSAGSPVPVMLDESLAGMADIDTMIKTRAAPLAHLKLAKLGGLDRLMAAGRMLQAAGIPVMVGQMNEGSVSTLAVAHAAVALRSRYHELYGADGLADDPAGALVYADGHLALPPGPGVGLARHAISGRVIWQRHLV